MPVTCDVVTSCAVAWPEHESVTDTDTTACGMSNNTSTSAVGMDVSRNWKVSSYEPSLTTAPGAGRSAHRQTDKVGVVLQVASDTAGSTERHARTARERTSMPAQSLSATTQGTVWDAWKKGSVSAAWLTERVTVSAWGFASSMRSSSAVKDTVTPVNQLERVNVMKSTSATTWPEASVKSTVTSLMGSARSEKVTCCALPPSATSMDCGAVTGPLTSASAVLSVMATVCTPSTTVAAA